MCCLAQVGGIGGCHGVKGTADVGLEDDSAVEGAATALAEDLRRKSRRNHQNTIQTTTMPANLKTNPIECSGGRP
jgi:hypothetical protein